MQSPRVMRYVAAVGLAALLGVVSVAGLHVDSPWIGMFLLASLAALGGAAPVRIPALKTAVSATDPFVFTAIAALGPMPACVVAACGVIGATTRRSPTRGRLQFCFNLGNVVCSTVLASWVFILCGGAAGGPLGSILWPLIAATTTYFLGNTALVTGVMVLDSGRSFVHTWRESGLWTAIPAYAGYTLSAGLLFILHEVGPLGLALGIPPCWLLAAFYRNHKERQEEQQQRIHQIEVLNHQLEDKVAERTDELQRALSSIEEANARLRQSNSRLTEANRAKSEFLANVSHELRTPLNAIIGFSDLLGDDGFGELNAQQLEFVKDIHESGEHLLNLINDILDLSKIEAGRMEVHLERLEIAVALVEATAMVRPQAGRKQLKLQLDCASDTGYGTLDPGMFRQTLINLLSNAVKFTPAGGSVTLEARRRDSDLEVAVIDSGIGISKEHQQRVFEEFYQVDGSYSRIYEGTGLGLALVRRMVELHHGSISVESTPGQGSRFSCLFPECLLDNAADLSDADQAEFEPVPGRIRVSGRRILLVEDNAVNRKLARNVLRMRGHEVVEAASGEDALDWLEHGSPDLILMDLQLPGLDGLEVTRRLKADPRMAAPPVVAVSASAQDGDIARARAAGCAGYITKPIRLAHFAREVESHLDGEREAVA